MAKATKGQAPHGALGSPGAASPHMAIPGTVVQYLHEMVLKMLNDRGGVVPNHWKIIGQLTHSPRPPLFIHPSVQ